MPCIVCKRPAGPHCLYCPRCRRIGDLAADDQSLLAIRAALIDAWDSVHNCFRCYFTHVPLNEKNRCDPFYLTLDHLVPSEERLVASSHLMNSMKNALTGEEFFTVVPALSDHLELGLPFDRDLIGFTKWTIRGVPFPAPRKVAPWESPARGVTDCVVCHGPLFPRSMYCARCRRFITVQRENAARRQALIEAFDRETNGFRCHYTGVLLDENDVNSPWYITFDHRIPGKKGDLVVAAMWVNRMKTFLTDVEFRAVLRELGDHIRHGTPFDKAVVDAKRVCLAIRRQARHQ